MPMRLVEIAAPEYDVELELAYATERNITGRPIYRRALCYLHADAADLLARAIILAAQLGFRIKVFDAFRPAQAQRALWNHCPDPDFLADPRVGSPHSRGVAVDLTLVDTSGRELEMGTGFDDFTPLAHHGAAGLSREEHENRMVLLGLMTTVGWDYYTNEWWHYQLFQPKRYPLVSDGEVPASLM